MKNYWHEKKCTSGVALVACACCVLVTALVVGAVVYAWQRSVAQQEKTAAVEAAKKNLQSTTTAAEKNDATVAATNTSDANTNPEETASTTSTEQTIQNEQSATTAISITKVSDPGVTWLTTPEELDGLNIFNVPDADINAHYYKIANLDDGGMLIFMTTELNMTGLNVRLKKDTGGAYWILDKHSDGAYIDYVDSGKYRTNYTQYRSLSAPDFLEVAGLTLRRGTGLGDREKLFQELEDSAAEQPLAKLAATEYGDVYKTGYDDPAASDDDPQISNVKFVLELADTTAVYYTEDIDFIMDDGGVQATWNDLGGVKKDMKFQKGAATGGCGIGPYNQIYLGDDLAPRLVQVGTTPSGDPLYDLKDSDDEFYRYAYDKYTFDGNRTDVMSYDEFVGARPLLFWQDPLGDYLIFESIDYAPMAECAKPVIYLYPEKQTTVTVKVGANISESEPAYNQGWEVLAYPGGAIRNSDGRFYDSLFWEGQGQGYYPLIQQGKVVRRADLAATLQQDLRSLGLTKKEAQDFLDFWLSKMPTTPFTRLTWLGTTAMNELAPLTISPRPDTLIRIFLDFEGLNENKIKLQPQKLFAPERKGFTVAEWGGLLRK